MKYAYYLPLIDANGHGFVLQGQYTETADGILLPNGELCQLWESFPKAEGGDK